MGVKERRLKKGWSQEYLAQVSGLSIRTIQRVENGHKPGFETLKSLAAVFDTDVNSLKETLPVTTAKPIAEPAPATNAPNLTEDADTPEQEAADYAENVMAFRLNLIMFCVTLPAFYLLNLAVSPGYLWVKWLAAVWTFAILLHALMIKLMFGVFNLAWEKRTAEDYLKRR